MEQKILLSPSLREKIGNSDVTIYPWDIALVAYNNLNYKPLPVFQAYSAYTPYLDELNSNFLEKTAPQFIIFNLDAIDGRFPLIESPKTWEAIYSNYKIDVFDEKYFLLSKKERDKREWKFVSEETRHFRDFINIPDSYEIVGVEIDFKLSAFGKLAKILFQVPEVQMFIEFDDGEVIQGRILPEVFKNKAIISQYPKNKNDIVKLLGGNGALRKVKNIRIWGAGTYLYKNPFNVKFYGLE